MDKQEPTQQSRLICRLDLTGKLPPGWRQSGKAKQMTVPRNVTAMGNSLIRRLAQEDIRTLATLFDQWLTEKNPSLNG